MTYESRSEEDTSAVGRETAAALKSGDVLLLSGPLGAGKTAFVRGLAEGLGCQPNDVSSPTFTILQEYPGRHRLYHADLYRLSEAEVRDLGLADMTSEGVLAVEWSERWPTAPLEALTVVIRDEGGDRRTIEITRPTTDYSTR